MRIRRPKALVGAAAAVALEVEGDVCVTDLLECLGHSDRVSVLQELSHFGGADLDTGQVEDGGWLRVENRAQFSPAQFMVADADVVEAEVAQDILRLLDHAKLLRGNGFTVGDPRAEASHLWFVGRGQPKLGGKRADVGFGQTGLLQRGADLEFSRRLGTGTEVPEIAGVLA